MGFHIRVHCLGIDSLTGALELTVLREFSVYWNIRFAGLALHFVELMLSLDFIWCERSSLNSQEIHVQNSVHV